MSPVWPLAAGALASASFIAMDAAVKTLAPRFDAGLLAFFRFASGSVFAALLWLWWRTPMPARSEWRWHGLRVVLLLFSLVGYFHALTLLPLAQAVAMSYLSPIFTSLLAIAVLGERPSRWIWTALACGTGGVGIALWPELQAGTTNPRLEGLLVAALAAASFSGVMVLARRQAQRDSVWTILLLQNVLPMLLLAAPAAWGWKSPEAGDLATIALIGAFATVGLLGVTWAFTHLEASRVAPLEYTSFLWAGVLGYLMFGEVPSAHTAVSAVLIVAGCLLLLRR
jgi:drug/metabolite transporter (DMT)-like permease